MKKAFFMTGWIVLSLLLPAFVISDYPDQNGWRGENRDGRIKGFMAPVSWPGALKQIWKVSVGLGDASPILVGNRLYLTTKRDSLEIVMCLEAENGQKVWEQVNNKAPVITGGAASHPGPRSTPVIAGDKIITVGAGGFVACRKTSDGELIWKSEAYTGEVPQFFVGGSPLVLDNKIIAHLNGKEKGVVVGLNIGNGSEIWKLEGESSTYSSPVKMSVFKNMVVVQGEKNLMGISSDKGELLWKEPTPPETRFYNSSTPVIDEDHVIIAGQGSGARNISLTKEGGNFKAGEVWKNPEISVSFNTPVLKEGYLYGNEARFGSLFCLNAKTGAKCWADTVKHNRFASVLDLGKVMVSLPASGWLIVFKPDNTKYQEIAKYKVAETEVYAHPVISGKRIFVKEKEFLTCWEL